jgi:ABC-type nitrate/sulfonate/bicarbonate transport system substrate-binding protein
MKYAIVAILLGILVLAGCTTEPKIPDERPELNLVVTGVGFNPIFYPLHEGKVAEPQSVNVKIVETSYSQAELYTLATKGTPTIGILSGANLAIAYNKGQRFKVLAPYYREIVGPKGFSVGQVVALKSSSINSPKDFYGKKIGVQGATDGSTMIMKTVLYKVYNIDLEQIEFVAVDSENAPALLEKGEIDAAMFDSDFIMASDFDSKYKTVLDFGKEMNEFYGTVPPAKFFVARYDEYMKNPEIYDDAIKYFRDNYQWSQDNLAEITRLEAEESGEDFDFLMEKAKYEIRLDKMNYKDYFAWDAIYETAYATGVLEFITTSDTVFK